MTFEAAVMSRLLNAPSVVQLVESRVDWERLPQGTQMPAVVVLMIADRRDQHFRGIQRSRPIRLQIDCWAARFLDAVLLRNAVIDALLPPVQLGSIRFQRAQDVVVRRSFDSREGIGERYRQIVELSLWHSV